MAKQNRQGVTGDRFVEAAIELIAENGGSIGVNLRSISRRVGCAHTNAYNYFTDFSDLLWSAYRRAIDEYGYYLTNKLSTEKTDFEYFRTVIFRLSSFPRDNPGLHRFISTDPLDIEHIPSDVLDEVARLKEWYVEVIRVAAGDGADNAEVKRISDIILAYISGESTDLVNGRFLPDDDVKSRIVANALHLFELLCASCGANATVMHDRSARTRVFPELPVTAKGE